MCWTTWRPDHSRWLESRKKMTRRIMMDCLMWADNFLKLMAKTGGVYLVESNFNIRYCLNNNLKHEKPFYKNEELMETSYRALFTSGWTPWTKPSPISPVIGNGNSLLPPSSCYSGLETCPTRGWFPWQLINTMALYNDNVPAAETLVADKGVEKLWKGVVGLKWL